MDASDIIAGLSAIISLLSVTVAWRAMRSAAASSRSARELQRNMFQRQHIIDLHHVWKDVNDIRQEEPITGDIRNAVNALDLTASLWNFDVVKKEIIISSYWDGFSRLYGRLDRWDSLVNGLNMTGRDMLSNHIRKAYEEMKELAIKRAPGESL